MTLAAAVVGVAKSPATPIVGMTSLILGFAEVQDSALLGFVGLFGGGGLLILAWLARSITRVMERWLDAQGEKIIDLPTREQRQEAARVAAHEKTTLMQKLEKFAAAADRERTEMSKFREALAATLADHGARITAMERRQGSGESPAVR